MEPAAVCFLVGLLVLVLACFAYGQPRAGDRVARWHYSIPDLNETPDRFYAQVYQALRDGLERGEVPLQGLGFGPSRLFEGRTIFSQRPLYFCARYKHLSYFLYVSQTPAGCFVSSWTYSKYVKGEGESRLTSFAAHRYFSRQTLFQFDALLMFNESLHAIVMEVLDRYIQEQGLKPLEEYERRPVYHAFYRNAFSQPAPQPQSFQPASSSPVSFAPQAMPSQAVSSQPFASASSVPHAPQAVPQGVPANAGFYASTPSGKSPHAAPSHNPFLTDSRADSEETNDATDDVTAQGQADWEEPA